jgi:hypothetical protein
MVNFYVHRIKAGKMKLEDVPARWYEAVKAELEKDE